MPEDSKIVTPNFEGEAMKMPENTDMQSITKEAKQSIINGPLLLGLALLLILILGGLYYWFGTLTPASSTSPTSEATRPTAEENNEPESTTAEAQVDMMNIISPSDEISAIEADIESISMDALDAELQSIDAAVDVEIDTQQ
jgi:hypothetical protein